MCSVQLIAGESVSCGDVTTIISVYLHTSKLNVRSTPQFGHGVLVRGHFG